MKPSKDGKISSDYMTKLIKEWLETNKVKKHPSLDFDPKNLTSGITAKTSAKSGGSDY